MNKIFKIVWSEAVGAFVVASELAKGHTKSTTVKKTATGLKILFRLTALAVAVWGSAGTAWAVVAPTGQVATGSGGETAVNGADARGTGAVAIGTFARAGTKTAPPHGINTGTIAIGGSDSGTATYADGNNAIAIGTSANSNGAKATSIGSDAIASDQFATALGGRAEAKVRGATAIGSWTQATGQFAVAIGGSDRFGRDNNTELNDGSGATLASGERSTAIGRRAKASGNDTLALGTNAEAAGVDAVALGTNANASILKSIAIGKNTQATGEASIVIGSDDVLYGEIKATSRQGIAIGTGAKATGATQAVAIGPDAIASGTQSTSIGNNTRATGDSSIAIGGDDWDEAKKSVNTQYKKLTGSDMSAGYQNTEAATAAVAVGVKTRATGALSTAFGPGAIASGLGASAFGVGAEASKDKSVAIGAGSNTSTNATAITTATVNDVTYSGFAGTTHITEGSQVSFGSVGYERQIKHVAPGEISATSTDAINGSQLYQVAAQAANPLKFDGDRGATVERKLGNTLNVKGGATGTLTDNNIGVVADNANNTLGLKLAQNVNLGATGSLQTGSTTINDDGVAITGGPSITKTGISAGNKPITNVASGGTTDSNAANIGDVKQAAAAAKTVVKQGANTSVSSATDAATGATEYTVNAEKSVVQGSSDVSVNAVTNGLTTTYTADLSTTAKASLAKADSAVQKVVSSNSNLTASKTGDTVTLDFSQTPNFTSVTTGNSKLSSDGLKIGSGTNSVSLTNTGLSNGGNKITNIADGAADTDAASFKQVKAAKTEVQAGTNVASVIKTDGTNGQAIYTINAKAAAVTLENGADGLKLTSAEDTASNLTTYKLDLADKTKTSLAKADSALQNIGVQVNGTAAKTLNQANSTLNFVNGTGTTAENKNGNIAFNVNKANLSVNGGTVSADKNGDEFATAKSVADAINKAVTDSEKTSVVAAGDNTHVASAVSGNQTTYTVHADKTTVSAKTGGKLNVTSAQTANANQTKTTNYELDLTDAAKAEIAKGVEAKTAVDTKGIGFAADSGSPVTKKLGDSLNIKGDNKNITTKTNNGDVQVALNDDISVQNVNAAASVITPKVVAGDSTLTSDGLNITGGPSITKTGISAGNKPITNVASGGTTDSNAANIGDVKQAAAAAKTVVKQGANTSVSSATDAATGATEYTVNAEKSVVQGSSDVSVNAVTNGLTTTYTADLSTTAKASLAKADSAVQKVVSSNSNLTASKTGDTVTLDFSQTPNFTSVTTGNSKLSSDGLKIGSGANSVSLTNAGLSNGGNKITNIADGAADTDAASYKQVKAAKTEVQGGTNVASVTKTDNPTDGHAVYTVNAKGAAVALDSSVDGLKLTSSEDTTTNVTTYKLDLADKTKTSLAKADSALQNIGVQVNGTAAKTLNQANSTLNFVNGTGTTAENKNGNIAFNVNKANLSVNGGTVSADKNGDEFATAKSVADAINKAVTDSEKTSVVAAGDNTHVASAVSGNQTTYTVHADKTTVSAKTGGKLNVTSAQTANANQTKTTNYELDLTDAAKAEIAKGVEAKTAVDTKGIGFAADSGSPVTKKLGDSLNIKGDNKNITTKINNGDIQVTLKEDISVQNVNAAASVITPKVVAGDSTLTSDGLNITGGPSITKAGISAGNKPITNVASGGTTDSNAANIGDVKKAAAAAKTVVKQGANTSVSSATDAATGATEYTVNAEKSVVQGSSDVSVNAVTNGLTTTYTADLSTTAKASLAKADSAVQKVVSSNSNLTASKTGDTVTLNFSQTPSFTSVTTGNSVLTTDGLKITNGTNSVSLTGAGLSNGGNKITNIADGAADTDAASFKQVKAAKTEVQAGTNVASVIKTDGTNSQAIYTVNAKGAAVSAEGADNGLKLTSSEDTTTNVTTYNLDLADKTKASLTKADSALQNIGVQVNGTAAKTLNQANSTLNFVNGTGTTAENKNGNIAFNVNKANLSVNGGTVSADKNGDEFATAKSVADAINKAVTDSEKTSVVAAGDNTHVASAVSGNQTTYTVHADKTTVSAKTGGKLNVTSAQTANANQTKTTNYELDLTDAAKAEIAKGVEAKTAVDTKGIGFAADSGSPVTKKLGDSLNIKGDNKNITTKINNGDIQVTLKEDISVQNVNAAASVITPKVVAGDSTLTSDGLNITGGPSITKAGISAGNKPITNVASGGTTDSNAANIGDVKKAAAAAKTVVKQGANTSVSSATDAATGATEYTVNAEKSVVQGSSDVSVNAVTNGLTTTYTADLSTTAKASLAKADTAVQKVVSSNSNLTASRTGDTVTLDFSQTPSFASVTTGNSVLTSDGLKIGSGANSVSLTDAGLSNGGNKITNIADGAADTDAASFKQVKAAKTEVQGGTNVASVTKTDNPTDGHAVYTVNAKGAAVALDSSVDGLKLTSSEDTTTNVTTYKLDLADKTKTSLAKADSALQNIGVQVNGTAAKTLNQANSTLNFVNGTGTTAENKNGNIAFNVNKANLSVNGGTVSADKNGDEFATAKSVADAINKAVTDSEKTSVVAAGDNTHVASAVSGNQTTYTVHADKTTVSAKTGGKLNVTSAQTANANQTKTTNYELDLTDAAKAEIAKGVEAKTAVDTKGIGFAADSGSPVTKKLGDSLNIKGDNKNIETEAGTDGIKVKLKDEITLTSVTANTLKAGDSVLTNDGLNIAKGTAGSPVSLTKSGLNNGGNKITKVAKGENEDDAVNYTQLKELADKGLTFDADGNTSTSSKKLGERVGIKGGNNITTSADNDNVTVKLNDDITLTSVTATTLKAGDSTLTTAGLVTPKVTAGNSVLENNGLTISNGTAGSSVSLTKNGLNNGGNKIANVAKGTEDTDGVNVSQIKPLATALNTTVGADGSIAEPNFTVNHADGTAGTPVHTVQDALNEVGKELNKGLNIVADNGSSEKVNLGDTVKYTSKDKNIVTTSGTGKEIDFSLAEKVTIGKDAANGGKPVVIDGKEGIVSGLTNTTLGAAPLADSNKAATEAQLDATQVNLANVLGGNAANNNGNVTTSDIGGTGESNVHDAIKSVKATADKGWKLKANDEADSESEKIAAGDTVTVKQGKNIRVKRSGKELTVETSDDVKFGTVSATTVLADSFISGNSVLSGEGLKIGADGSPSQVSLTNAGLNNGGNKIVNVAKGTEDNDAVNVAQLNEQLAATEKTTTVVAGKNVTVSEKVDGNNTEYTVNADKTTLSQAANGAVKVSEGAKDADGVTDYALDLTDEAKADIAKGVAAKDAVDNKGLTFAADNGTTGAKKLGDSLSVKGDGNILTRADENGIGFSLADKITVGKAGKGNKPLVIDGTAGLISGLSNTTLGGADFATKGQAASEEQLNATQANLANLLGGNAANDKGNVTTADIGGTGKDNVHDAIAAVKETADKGWNLNANDETSSEKIGAGDTVTFKEGKNVKVSRNGKNITVATSDDVSFDKVTVGGSVLTDNGLTVGNGKAGKPVSLTKDGLNNGGNKVSDIAAGEADTDAVNVAQLKAAAAKATSKVDSGNDNIVVTPEQNADGSTTYKVATAPNLKADSFTAGDTVVNNDGVKVGDKVALGKDGLKAGDVNITADGINAGNKAIGNVAAGVKDTDAANVGQLNRLTAAAKTEVEAGTNIASVTGKQGANGQTVYTVNADGASVSAGSDNIVVTKGNKDADNVTDYAVDLSKAVKADIAKGVAAKDAVDNKGISFAGDSGTTVANKLGDTVAVKGDANITTTAGANGIQVGLNKDLKVDSVKAGDTVVNNSGVNVGDKVVLGKDGLKAGDVNITADGINAGNKKVTGVAAGTVAAGSTDAVNGGQLHQVYELIGSNGGNVNTAPPSVEADGKAGLGNIKNITLVDNSNNPNVTNVTNETKIAQSNGYSLVTYNVEDQGMYVTNNVIEAVGRMNEQGIKFFHTNDGKVNPDVQAYNSEDSSASGAYATAVGFQAASKGTNAIAIGKGAKANAENTIAIGTGNIVSGKNSGAIGDPTVVSGNSAYSIGNNNNVSADNAYALGSDIKATVKDSVYLGDRAQTQGIRTADAAKGEAYTYGGLNDKAVAGKAGSTAAANKVAGVVTVGNGTDETRQVQGVAAGVVSADSTDAINGSQLYYTNQAIANVATQATAAKTEVTAGKNVVVNQTTGNSGQTVYNVATADKLDVTSVTAGGVTVNAQGVSIAAPTANNPANTVSLSPIGLNNGGQRITNVAPAKEGTDAVNLNQLAGMGNALQNNIERVGKKAYAGVAGAIAHSSIPQVTRPGATGLSVGSGYYGGQSAVAVGLSTMSDNGNWVFKGSFSANTDGHLGVGAGALYQW